MVELVGVELVGVELVGVELVGVEVGGVVYFKQHTVKELLEFFIFCFQTHRLY